MMRARLDSSKAKRMDLFSTIFGKFFCVAVDGDTIVVSPNEKVRLIGVDTPETDHPRKAVQCLGNAQNFPKLIGA